MTDTTPPETAKDSGRNTPPGVITAHTCLMDIVFYGGATSGLANLLLDFRAPWWVNLLWTWAIFAPVLISAVRDRVTIWRTGQPITLTTLQIERRTNFALRWGTLLFTICVLGINLRGALTLYNLSYFTIHPAALFALFFHATVAIVLWKKVSESNRRLAFRESEATEAKPLAVAASIATESVVPSTAPKHWWTSTDTRDEIQQNGRK